MPDSVRICGGCLRHSNGRSKLPRRSCFSVNALRRSALSPDRYPTNRFESEARLPTIVIKMPLQLLRVALLGDGLTGSWAQYVDITTSVPLIRSPRGLAYLLAQGNLHFFPLDVEEYDDLTASLAESPRTPPWNDLTNLIYEDPGQRVVVRQQIVLSLCLLPDPLTLLILDEHLTLTISPKSDRSDSRNTAAQRDPTHICSASLEVFTLSPAQHAFSFLVWKNRFWDIADIIALCGMWIGYVIPIPRVAVMIQATTQCTMDPAYALLFAVSPFRVTIGQNRW